MAQFIPEIATVQPEDVEGGSLSRARANEGKSYKYQFSNQRLGPCFWYSYATFDLRAGLTAEC